MTPEPLLPPEVARLGRAIRFAFVTFLVVLSFITMRASLAVPAFEQIFNDMLNGKEMPAITMAVIKVHNMLVMCSFIVPAFAIGTLFSGRLVGSFYVLGALCLITATMFLLIYLGMTETLYEIIRTMHGG